MEHIVTIEKVIAGGSGLARLEDGRVVMVPLVLAGEQVRIREREVRKGYLLGEAMEILLPSKARIAARCRYYTTCGGCDLQHAEYAEQLRIKEEVLCEALRRAKLSTAADRVEKTIPSAGQWEYRNRLRLKVDSEGRLGFFRKQSNTFLAIESCPLAGQEINRALAELQSPGVLCDLARSIREVELLLSPADRTVTLKLLARTKLPAGSGTMNRLAACNHISAVVVVVDNRCRQLVPAGKEVLLEQQIPLPGVPTSCRLSWSSGCFSQINVLQNEQLIHLVCSLAGHLEGKTVLDLFCGMGNFSIPLALRGAAVTGIEWNRESIHRAKGNARRAGVCCSFFAGDVQQALRELVRDNQKVDTILLDPPRRGLGATIKLLPALEPEQIIYISCDPATLARDLIMLSHQGYAAHRVLPMDMFPQTHHIESVTLLKKIDINQPSH